MKTLIVATSAKPPNFESELKLGKRYRLEYLDLSKHLPASYMDYDPPWMHTSKWIRQLEERTRVDFYWAWQIARKVRKEGYEVVVSMSERIAVPLGVMLDHGVKHIAILINALSPKWLLAIKSLKLHRRWNHIITYSHAEADALQNKLKITSEKISTILNYVDVNFFKPTQGARNEAAASFFFSQGLAKRDYPTLIAAMQNLPQVECHISAVSAWDDFKAGYEGLEIPGNVILKSYNHPSIIKDIFEQCRFLVIPLRPDVGMWCSGSTSVLQAQAMGKPVIVTYLPGIAEYVQDGETGILVEGNNPDALAKTIDFLWQNPAQAKKMGRQGQQWVNNQFTLENRINNLTDLLEDVTDYKRAQYSFKPG